MPTTVTIGGTTYNTYVSVAQVDAYANGSLTADAWEALVADDKARVIVTVTRWIDGECWQGDKLDDAQPLAFPRTVGDIATIEQAAILLSIITAANPDLPDNMTGNVVAATDGGTKSLAAGSVRIEYFKNLNFSVYGNRFAPFPRNVMGMLAQWLCGNDGSGGDGGASAYGTCRPAIVGVRGFGYVEPF